tara:strand:+ start:7642 stop:8385 length:744 start_codon:yes stop_codon:yes gene_type:complete
MEEWQEGEIIENKKWTENLASLKIKAKINPHKAGQFTRLGLMCDNDFISRSYSYASAPEDDILEIIYVNIPNGIFSPQLHQLKRGDKISVMRQAIGYFTLEEIPEGKNLWMLASGTALGVFLSILKTSTPWDRFEKIILIHGVRYSEELIYQDLISEIKNEYLNQFEYLSSVTRDSTEKSFNMRIPKGLQSRAFQNHTQIEINSDSQFMICGNPEMIKETSEVLKGFGLNKNRRAKPGNITVERYWV